MKFLYFFVLLFVAHQALASPSEAVSPIAINNFIVKEHLIKNGKIAIIACDETETPLENINGVFQFSINGFKQELKFNEGIAVPPQPINESTFLYLRHKNETGTHGKLFYIIKKEDSINPIKISWYMLALIPIALILIAMTFRKLLIYAVIVLAVLFYFNTSKGLSFPTFFDTIFDGLKSVF